MFLFLLCLIIIDSFILSACSYDKNPHPGFAGFCSVLLLIFVAGAVSTGMDIGFLDILWGIVTRPWEVVGVISLYVGIGLVWAGKWKWRRINDAEVANYIARKDVILAEWKAAQGTYSARGATYESWLLSQYNFPPRLSYYKERLTNWTALWPFSMGATFLYDWVYKFFSSIVEYCQNWFHNIQRRIWQRTGIYDVPVATAEPVAPVEKSS